MLKLISSSLILIISIVSCRHSKMLGVHINYPDARWPMDTAVLFSPGIISSDLFEHSSPVFSSDGKTVLWSIVEMPSWKASIFEMNYLNDHWSAPQRSSFCDTSASDIYPSFSPDYKILYFSSSRKLPTGQYPSKGNVIWMVEKTSSGWAAPQPFDLADTTGGRYSPSMSNSENLYFTYGPFRSPDWDIMMAKSKGTTTLTTKLPPPINTTGYEDGPCIAPDESYLIFESDRAGGFEGSTDLYISFKLKDGAWSTPLNMGPGINSNSSERFARVSPDGKFLFFGSNRRQVNGKPNFDIYWITGSVISILREQSLKYEKM